MKRRAAGSVIGLSIILAAPNAFAGIDAAGMACFGIFMSAGEAQGSLDEFLHGIQIWRSAARKDFPEFENMTIERIISVCNRSSDRKTCREARVELRNVSYRYAQMLTCNN